MKLIISILLAFTGIINNVHANEYSCITKTMEELAARIMYVRVLKGEKPNLEKGGTLLPKEDILEDEVNVEKEELLSLDSASTYKNRNGQTSETYDFYELVYHLKSTNQSEFKLEVDCLDASCNAKVLDLEGQESNNILSYQSIYKPSYKTINVSLFPYFEDQKLKVLMEVNTEIAIPGDNPFSKFSMRNTAVARYNINEIPNTISIEALNHVQRPVSAMAYANDRRDVTLAEIECKKY